MVEFYDVERQPLTTILYNHDGSFFVKVFDRQKGAYIYESPLTDWRTETATFWAREGKLLLIGGDIMIELPD